MHTFSETGAAVPAFLAKLWRLVDDPKTDHLICWSKDGRSFIIQNQAQFARELLPLNYKHNNMASFIRQLNMYGFHKITSIDNGGLKFDRDEMEFSHPCFKRGSSYLLEHIKRKIANSKALDEKSNVKTEAVTKVLQDVKAMRGRQESLDSRFLAMKQENQALWREIASLRQKHAKQQQIVNKLIHFLISIVQPTRNMTGVKRHIQLMINDNPQNERNLSESEPDCGPIIHELSEELLDEVANPSSNLITEHHPDSPERPQSSMSMISNNYDYSNQSAEDGMVNTMSNMNADGNADVDAIVTSPTSPGFIQTGSGKSGSGRGGGGVKASNTVYDVDEDAAEGAMNAFNEENHLATPMVRQQMQRTLLLKQRNKQRRKPSSSPSHIRAKQMRATQTQQQSLLLTQQQRLQQQKQQQQRQQKQKPQVSLSMPQMDDNEESKNAEAIKIKCENQDTNESLYFLDFENGEADIMSALNDNTLSQNFNANNMLNDSPNINISMDSTPTPSVISMPSPNLYSANTYLSDDINQDLFEDSNLLSANREPTIEQINNNNNNNKVRNLNEKLQKSQQQEKHQQFEDNFLTSDKFSSFLAANNNTNINNNNDNCASTSAAAYASATGGKKGSMSTCNNNGNDNSLLLTTLVNEAMAQSDNNNEQQQDQENNQGEKACNLQNMALAKYNKTHQGQAGGELNLDILSDEVSGHIENVQDELETLKELLRSDGYSLDTSTLLGNEEGSFQAQTEDLTVAPVEYLTKLFDSDVMNPYGNNLQPNDNNTRTGSELATYQPIYDLSDIMDMDKSPKSDTAPSTSQGTPSRRLTLNTPIHE